MFDIHRKSKIKKYTEEALEYVSQVYITPTEISKKQQDNSRNFTTDKYNEQVKTSESLFEQQEEYEETRYSFRDELKTKDMYNVVEVTSLLRNYSNSNNPQELIDSLEHSVNQTFVEKLVYYIIQKGLKPAKIYKQAQIDKRLFSKIVLNHEYKPSKDTAIALALALKLSLEEALDLLSRAGYTLSHSDKRDIIIEFFFRESMFDLMDLNDVLYSLGQKIIGRT